LRGRTRAPSDKSVSHRALILGGLARGDTEIEGLLEADDVLATARAVRAFGAEVEQAGPGRWRVRSDGEFRQPDGVIDCGNSGTAARLLMGAMGAFPIEATFDGDASLRRRPMDRVLKPLAAMGVQVRCPEERLPATLYGGFLRGLAYEPPVASAQVKSAVLLAGLNTPGITRVIEPVATRDHSERMLAGFGADLHVEQGAEGRVISLRGEADLRPQRITVPGDPSSAAFWMVAASIVPGSDVVVANVGLNPTRTGLLTVLRMMGASIEEQDPRVVGGEPVADLRVRHATLTGIEVPLDLAPSMIDEYPILFVAAAFAQGQTVARGAHELRVKESDRIAAMRAALTACGVDAREHDDGLTITGSAGEPIAGGAKIATQLDHRIAMSMAVAALHARAPVTLDDAAPVATSYPGFFATLDQLAQTPEVRA
jgi:3-phosphoshikimate 1-carboxyvinyltransferase